MKKRILCVAFAIVLSVVCCSCADGQVASETSAKSSAAEPSASVSTASIVEKPNPVSTEPTFPADGREYGVLYEPVTRNVVIVDDANPIKKFNLSGIQDPICGIYWPYVVTLAREYTPDGNNICYVNAYNMECDEIASIYSGQNIKSADIYEGICYILIYNDKTGEYTELAYDMKTFESVPSPCQEMYDKISSVSIVDYSLQKYDYDEPCLKEVMDRAGYAILYLSYGHYGLFDGNEYREISFEDRIYDVEDYTEDLIIYSAWDEDYRNKYLFVNCNDGPVYIPTEQLDQYLGCVDGIVYFSTSSDETFGLPCYNVCAFDPKTGETDIIYSFNQNPGMSRMIKPGVSGFSIYDGDFYYVADDGNETEWYRTFINVEGVYETEKLGAGVLTYDFLNYGSVSFNTDVLYCEDCGRPVSCYYGEIFVVDDNISKQAGKISDYMYMDDIASLMSFEDGAGEYEDMGCEAHASYYGCQTQNVNVTGVHLRGEKYITIDFEGYWYGGGAHGMEFVDHYLFDLETGERVYLKDLFDGSDEEFKDIIARYTQIDYESYSQGLSPYFAESADAVYEQAFEYADLDTFCGRFTESGIVVEYAPYMMGAYASGIISFEIPYSEFRIEDILY